LKILVGYDGSAQSDKALTEAIDIVEKYKGSITLVHVNWDKGENELRRLLRPVEERLKKIKIKHTIRVEQSENPPRRIVRVAVDEKSDLIIIGNRGLGGARAWLLGSVASKVIEDSPCTVLIVK
jgi:nucleotide-binding universal stress UspA family protein